jgi:hypothetical protein
MADLDKQLPDLPPTVTTNKTDLLHLRQGGSDKKITVNDFTHSQDVVTEWDNTLEYTGGLSIVKSDTNLYVCNITNTNVNPVGDLTGTWQLAIDNPVVTRETEGSYTWTQYKYPSGRLRLVFAGNVPVTTATTTNVTLQYPTSFIAVATEPHSVNVTANNITGNRNGYAFTVNGGTAASKDEVAIRYVTTATGTGGSCWTSIVAEGRWK